MREFAVLCCGSNYERQRESITGLHRVFKNQGDALYVMTCYEATGGESIPKGDEAIYTLTKKRNFDGYVVDDCINSDFITKYFFENGVFAGKPVVMESAESELAPSIEIDSYGVVYDLLAHLIEVHGCKKINFVAPFAWLEERYSDYGGLRAYNAVMLNYGLELNKNRFVDSVISIPEGEAIWDKFVEKGVDDCDAVLCFHDIYAIGLFERLKKENKRVPEDIKLVTIRRSENSVTFRPDISGAVNDDYAEAIAVKELMYEQINGNMLRPVKTYNAHGVYGGSCGCSDRLFENEMAKSRAIVLNKISSGTQVKALMHFNDTLEKVSSLEEYADLVDTTYTSFGCKTFAVCINKRDIAYILDADDDIGFDPENPFDDNMYVLAGRDGEKNLMGQEIGKGSIVPFDVEAGDLVTLMPILHDDRAFGYVILVNDYLPYNQYNYRICHETLGNSIEGLRRQMVLKHTINELNELRTRDPLTGLYNREYIKSFRESLSKLSEFTVTMFDMDGLKKINDAYGHEEGNRAICILATAINRAARGGEIAVRYGGDEFVVLSPFDAADYWESQKEKLNAVISEKVKEESLPYSMGVSLGYAVHTDENQRLLNECLEIADVEMYKNKMSRKACRTD